MSQGRVEEKVTIVFRLIWETPHERAPSREKNCSTSVCAGLSPGFPAWQNDFQVCKKNDFLKSSCFSSTIPFKTLDKIFWKCPESWDGCQNDCQDPVSPSPQDGLCFGTQTQEHKPDPRSLQEITGYKLLPKSKPRRTSITSRKALRLGRLAQPKKTWGVCWHCWSWLWPWQHSAVVRKVRGHLPRKALRAA